MSRYIDANKLIAHLEDEIEECRPLFGSGSDDKIIAYGTTLGLKSAIAFAKALPTSDVVEVVRCKDCKYWRGDTCGQVCLMYSGIDTKVCTDKDHFCSGGERREG